MKKVILSAAALFVAIFYFALIKFVVVDNPRYVYPSCKDCNIVMINMTNLRYDHMSSNGYFRKTTPNLDALARESLVFDNAFSHSSWTLPEGISIFTSLYPYTHGVMGRYAGETLSGDTLTFVDVLNDNGYKTAAFTGGFDYDPVFGLTGRFDEHEECKPRGIDSMSFGGFNCSIPGALEWVKNNFDKKFFVFVQGFDAHCPFSQEGGHTYDKDYEGTLDYSKCLWTFDRAEPVLKGGKTYYPVSSRESPETGSILLSEEDVAHLIALYDESITSADAQIGELLDGLKSLGLYDNTIIVFTSEHGDMFGKYGRFMRGGPLRGTFYDDVLHIPLTIMHPKLEPRRIDQLVGHIDIVPTLLDLLSITKFKPFFQGKSLVPAIFYGEEVNEYIFSGSEFTPPSDNEYFNQDTIVETIRSNEWKLIKETFISDDSQFEILELYDIVNDKEELRDLASAGEVQSASTREILEDLRLKLDAWSDDVRVYDRGIFYDLQVRVKRLLDGI